MLHLGCRTTERTTTTMWTAKDSAVTTARLKHPSPRPTHRRTTSRKRRLREPAVLLPCRPSGSSSYITNLDGEVVQHIEYVPFGEVFIEERNNIWNTPYLFNAKEFDEETGLYYYGARYYDPRLSLWISTDALKEKTPNISPYVYTENSPITYIDPDGNFKWKALAEASRMVQSMAQ